jgi:hypothetical protein
MSYIKAMSIFNTASTLWTPEILGLNEAESFKAFCACDKSRCTGSKSIPSKKTYCPYGMTHTKEQEDQRTEDDSMDREQSRVSAETKPMFVVCVASGLFEFR